MCDFYTSVRNGGTKLMNNDPVIGLLFGRRNDTQFEVIDSSEAIYSVENGIPNLNLQEIVNKQKMITAVYPTYSLIGWYAVDNAVSEWHLLVQHALQSILEPHSLFCLLNSESEVRDNESSCSLYYRCA